MWFGGVGCGRARLGMVWWGMAQGVSPQSFFRKQKFFELVWYGEVRQGIAWCGIAWNG
ncbi:MAG: hypothetical protein MUC49_02085 [Raineya sp.]|nr:hypothetical protein [Raineya sp.]